MTVRAVVPAPVLPGPAEAQALIDEHLRSDLVGRCCACGQIAPCHWRAVAHAALFAVGLLPKRRSGIDRSATVADPQAARPQAILATDSSRIY